MKSKFLILTLFAVLAVAVLALLYIPGNRGSVVDCRGNGILAPPFSLEKLEGGKVQLSDFRGKVILLDFWATWCPPCQEGLPYLNDLHKRYGPAGLVVIGISMDRGGPEEVQRFVDQKGVAYINVMGNEEVVDAYSRLPGLGPIKGIPTAFLVDREGRICRKFVGLTRKHVFEEALKALL